jgi:glycosyltransferase involved in cell wall biosynthesis
VPLLLPGDPPPGFLRLFVVFHESEALGAGRAVVNSLGPLGEYGWATTGWFPGAGPLLEEAAGSLAAYAYRGKPLRYSLRGWRSGPGIGERLADTPAYLRAFRDALLRSRPHVVHANTLRALPEARIARSLGLPVVLHLHELPDPGAKRTLAMRAAATTADVVVAVSEAVAGVVRRHAGDTPVLVAYNGIPSVAALAERPRGPVVGSVGTVCRAKGTDVFLEAAALVRSRRPELRFEHIGQAGLDEDVEFARRIERLLESNDVRSATEMLGRRPAAEGLHRWQLFVLPSRQDAFPLASLEAMAAGVPVIASSVGGIPEQIEHLRSGILVEPGDPRAIAEWILLLHDDPDLRASLAAAASARVRERFTLDRQAAVLHKAYLAALNLRHGPPPVRKRTLESV